jgi:hypothetical protein
MEKLTQQITQNIADPKLSKKILEHSTAIFKLLEQDTSLHDCSYEVHEALLTAMANHIKLPYGV